MPTIDALADRLESYLEKPHIDAIRRAYFYAEQAHEGQKRRSGEAYISHPLEVAIILADMHMDQQSLMAAMLHDVIEDTGIPKEALIGQFGNVVTDLVDGVSKLTHINFDSKEEAQAENFQKMAMAMANDIRVILVKLADRLHNMRTLGALKPEKRRRIARETLDIYAPIAQRLGINDIRIELEDLCFRAMHPMRAELIQKAIRTARGNRAEIVEKISFTLSRRLKEEGIDAKVVGREKHLYSIYTKMKARKKSFKEIMDVYGFRIVVDSVDGCYRALGAVHNLYKPVPGRFKDYIAIPKANGYQSLHTTLKGIGGVPIEIQIRSKEMDAMAHSGIAAHWLYKSDEELPVSGHQRAQQWVQSMMDIHKKAGNPMEFIENVKIDLFPDEVYVFSPKGKIMEMPKGVTAVDFAYAVHTDVGNGCVACKIDGHLSPLSTRLDSGQTVEIITAPGAHPNPAWLNFVKTGKARTGIRHYLKNKQQSEAMALGRRMLQQSLSQMSRNLDEFDEDRLQQVAEFYKSATFSALLEELGMGHRMAFAVARQLISGELDEVVSEEESSGKKSALAIKGTEGMLVEYGKCCSPIPGDTIVGHISSGRGIVIHQENCRNLNNMANNPDRYIHLSWDKEVDGEFSVELRIWVENQRGMIASIASSIASAEGNIEQIYVDDHDSILSIVRLTLLVSNRQHLARIMRKVRQEPAVKRIARIRNQSAATTVAS